MNRQIILVVFVVLLVVSGVGFYILSRSKPQPVTPAASAPAPVVTTPPATAPEPPPVDAPPVTRRAAPPARAAAAPPPAAAPAAPVDLVTLHVDSDVPGAQVFVDRQFIGAAPVTTTEVKPGTHQINVSAPGYDQYAQSIDIEPGPRDVMVRFKEVRLDAKAEVIHKHGIGSCRGTLIATPQGLRYDTTNKGDAFSVTLTNLDVFQVDYLEKNLKVKIKGGKQYNFTDPMGNADNLFVFQRDVDKARQRLLKGD
ncbi:MAG TPA: PEGA domain-containing protein [Vicinamibacterales bacterium]|nr:PEGA domain-containing protein [Vicinamibacterales bacterium]